MVTEVHAVHGQPFSIPEGWYIAQVLHADCHHGGTTITLLLEEA